jgi:hypothetical protein
MQLSDVRHVWRTDGFAIVPRYLSAAETLAGTALRYPGLDLAPWAGAR